MLWQVTMCFHLQQQQVVEVIQLLLMSVVSHDKKIIGKTLGVTKNDD